MKKKLLIMVGILVLVLLSAAGITMMSVLKNKDTSKERKIDESTFSAHTDVEVFQNLPIMEGKDIQFTNVEEVGGENYMLYGEHTTFDEYQAYLKLLEKNGFKKQVDNGDKGINEQVYLAHYLKEDLLVTVIYSVNLERTIINATTETLLSPNLSYEESYVAGNKEGAKTKLHAQELYNIGNSYLFQLKNGHFILSDGGSQDELPYLLDYMESLVPKGEIPIIEAWFITHSHTDHAGIMRGFAENKDYAKRVYIDSIYYNEPNKQAIKQNTGYDSTAVNSIRVLIKTASDYLKTSDGTTPKVYRPRVGERYYFNDFTIEMVYSPELLPASEWHTWNAGCFVQMYCIEGQKVLITGDTEFGNQEIYMSMFDSEYFNLDIYQAPHHGINVHNEFTNYCSAVRTVLYPTWRLGSGSSEESELGRVVQNLYLREKAQEAYSFSDGTKIFTFPYSVGSVEILPSREWIYNKEEPSWKAHVHKQY